MPGAKEVVRKILDDLDDNVSLEEIQYHIYVRQKIERARKDVDEGRVVSHEEARKRLARWTEK